MLAKENYHKLSSFHYALCYSSDSEVNIEAGLKFCPPSGFMDSQEFSDAECDRDRALDLEVQKALEKKVEEKILPEELTSLLAR